MNSPAFVFPSLRRMSTILPTSMSRSSTTILSEKIDENTSTRERSSRSWTKSGIGNPGGLFAARPRTTTRPVKGSAVSTATRMSKPVIELSSRSTTAGRNDHPRKRRQREDPAEEDAELGRPAHAKFSVTRTIAGLRRRELRIRRPRNERVLALGSGRAPDAAPAVVTPPATTLRIRGCSPASNRSVSPRPRTTRRIENSSQEAIVPEVGAALTRSGRPLVPQDRAQRLLDVKLARLAVEARRAPSRRSGRSCRNSAGSRG